MKDVDLIEEVHRIRQEIASREGNDMKRILAAALARQEALGRSVVRGAPKEVREALLRATAKKQAG